MVKYIYLYLTHNTLAQIYSAMTIRFTRIASNKIYHENY